MPTPMPTPNRSRADRRRAAFDAYHTTTTPTPMSNLVYALEQESPLGHWSDGAQAADVIRTLTRLLDGVLQDDPDSIRAAVAWLSANVDAQPTP